MFRICGRDDHQAPAAVKFMTDFLKAKTIFIVDDKTTYSQGLAEEVAANCEKSGIQILAHDHVNQGDKDYSAVLTKVRQANPDVFYISLQNSATGALMLIQAKRMGIEAACMGQDAVYHPQLMEIAKEAAEGRLPDLRLHRRDHRYLQGNSKPPTPSTARSAPIPRTLTTPPCPCSRLWPPPAPPSPPRSAKP